MSHFKTFLLNDLLLLLLALAFLFTTCFLSYRDGLGLVGIELSVLVLGAIEVSGFVLGAIEQSGLVLPDLRESRILKNDPG